MLFQIPNNTEVTIMQLDWKASPHEAIADFKKLLKYHNEANKAVEIDIGNDQYYLCIFPYETHYTTKQLKAIINDENLKAI